VILQFIRIIPEGKMGVAHSPFGGTKMNYLLSSGINITNPTIKIALYPSVSQKLIQEIKILSRDGSQVNIKFQTVYRISPRWVTRLHKNVGPNYEDVLLKPEIESMIKVFIGMYNENEIRLISHDMLPILIMSHLNGPDGNSAIAIESSAWL
jgi:hypothetical protein